MDRKLRVKIQSFGIAESYSLSIAGKDKNHILVKLKEFIASLYDDFDNAFVYEGKKLLFKLSRSILSAPVSISVVGTGYVGLISGVGLAMRGRKITCVDIDENKINMIKNRISPIFEAGLQEELEKLPKEYFMPTTDLKNAIMNSDATMIAVGTPCKENGEINLGYLKEASKEIGKILKNKHGHLVIVKSTVIPGTTENTVKKAIIETAGHSNFEIAMVPEFLREGLAMNDFLYPDRIVIGAENPSVANKIKFIFKEFETKFYVTTIRTAEMIKYASNSMLAVKISFANEFGNLCKAIGIDVYEVMDGVALDRRINRAFLNAGRGFGGSCFPKDVQAIRYLADQLKVETKLLDSIWALNKEQPKILVKLAEKHLGKLKGKNVAVLGLAFKPGTDDIRESPAIIVINELLKKGANVYGYDPVAEENMKKIFPNIAYAAAPEEAIKNADIVIGVTEWPDLKKEELYKGKIFIDGMKFFNKKTEGNYEGICW